MKYQNMPLGDESNQVESTIDNELRVKCINALVLFSCLGWFLIAAIEPSNIKILFAVTVFSISTIAYRYRHTYAHLVSFSLLLLLALSIVLIMPFYAGAHDISLIAFA